MKLKFKSYRRVITTSILISFFIISFASLILSTPQLIHKNGLKALKEIIFAMFAPDLSPMILKIAIESVFQTLAYAAAGITIAIIVGFLLAIPSSEIFKTKKNRFNVAKNTLAFMRGIHEIIWAWFFVASIGLTPFSAILAIAIPYGGTLGKIFSDILRNTPRASIDSLKRSGASNIQQIIYGVIPLNYNQLKSYMFYRFECAIRSSAILSFIGLGGLGYQINISLQDLKYSEVWTFVYTLVIVVVVVDYIAKVSRSNDKKKIKRISSKLLTLVFILSWAYLILFEGLSVFKVFTSRNLQYSIDFLEKLIGLATKKSPYLDISTWFDLSKLAIDTLQMSIIAIGVSSFAMLATIGFANKRFVNGSFITLKRIIYSIIHALYIFTRTVPELIWAVILIFIFKPGILPGALALGIHNFGILGKLCSELIEDHDNTATMSLYKSGSSKLQAFVYGTIPSLYPRFISYILYRFEIIVRASIIVGIVGAGGLGEIFKLSMSYFHYGKVGMIIIVYLILVILTDYISIKLQKFNS